MTRSELRRRPRRPPLTLAECQALFHYPVAVAAQLLGVSRPTISKVLRAHGVSRWPFRKLNARITASPAPTSTSTPTPTPVTATAPAPASVAATASVAGGGRSVAASMLVECNALYVDPEHLDAAPASMSAPTSASACGTFQHGTDDCTPDLDTHGLTDVLHLLPFPFDTPDSALPSPPSLACTFTLPPAASDACPRDLWPPPASSLHALPTPCPEPHVPLPQSDASDRTVTTDTAVTSDNLPQLVRAPFATAKKGIGSTPMQHVQHHISDWPILATPPPSPSPSPSPSSSPHQHQDQQQGQPQGQPQELHDRRWDCTAQMQQDACDIQSLVDRASPHPANCAPLDADVDADVDADPDLDADADVDPGTDAVVVADLDHVTVLTDEPNTHVSHALIGDSSWSLGDFVTDCDGQLLFRFVNEDCR